MAASGVPVISAVGHETDVTTSDLVADVRAPTPSAAAEILSTDRAETIDRLRSMVRRIGRDAGVHVAQARSQLELRAASGVFRLPLRRIGDWRQLTDDLRARSSSAVLARLALLQEGAVRAKAVLAARSPSARLAFWSDRLATLNRRGGKAATACLQQSRLKRERHAHALELLGPRQTLARGFTITMDNRGRPLTSARQAAGEEVIVTVFADGEIKSAPVV
jgi:exodeoxyribonuclease VII large subunit